MGENLDTGLMILVSCGVLGLVGGFMVSSSFSQAPSGEPNCSAFLENISSEPTDCVPVSEIPSGTKIYDYRLSVEFMNPSGLELGDIESGGFVKPAPGQAATHIAVVKVTESGSPSNVLAFDTASMTTDGTYHLYFSGPLPSSMDIRGYLISLANGDMFDARTIGCTRSGTDYECS